MWSLATSLATVGSLLSVADAISRVTSSIEENGSQYLGFNGTISAKTTYPSSGSCDETFGPFAKSYFYVGLNPPWDSNPFFFELYHLASEGSGGPVTFTKDDVYNLDFGSSGYVCYSEGKPCGYFETVWYYQSEILLDLTKAAVKKTKVGNEDGYEISGDQKTYLKNETERQSLNRVDVDSECGQFNWNYDFSIWNETSTWSYTFSFSNTTATGSIKTTLGENSMEITYTGERMTNATEHPNIELVSTDDSKPQFRFSNDSDIHFKNSTHGEWLVSAEEFPAESSSSSRAGFAAPTSTTRRGGATGTGTAGVTSPTGTGAAEVLKASSGIIAPLLMLGGFFAL
ncbi:hypothetical protein BU24DRAFT_494510 [Aaosphaeria arxii CBS 175.79]|uniref:Uncharacterized protein n=1 Tax=Aaosphaeria arxii CBS 175.79 TaxID=1450172 RepID=A0A6A5XI42_9PLEO|nr:uncharacterized protein BU24DRAFT_494510 [Aaosphaeria arxii CBS 175.79]KAF2012517.1 hypothetical protein BU24DRAFT_494510 [Aaosphaeria arxii CBS 175.79]